MGRKTRKQLARAEREPFLTFYDDYNALWINRLCEEVEGLAHLHRPRTKWKMPKRVYLKFSTQEKPKPKEEKRNARKGKERADTGRHAPRKGERVRRGKRSYL